MGVGKVWDKLEINVDSDWGYLQSIAPTRYMQMQKSMQASLQMYGPDSVLYTLVCMPWDVFFCKTMNYWCVCS